MTRRTILLELAVTNAFVSQLFDQTLMQAGVQPTQVGILMLIRESEPVTPTELERICGLAGATLRDRVRQLLREDLVERRQSDSDRRSYLLMTTRHGQAILERARPVVRRVERLIEAQLGTSLSEHRELVTRLGAAAQAALR